ncbi:MAG: sensor histidine kinase [Agriterribacter sp.]
MLFLALPFLFSPDRSQGFWSVIKNPGYFNDLIRYILLLLFFYFNYYFLIPRYYFSEKYFIYFAIIIVCFFSISFLPQLLMAGNPGNSHEAPHFTENRPHPSPMPPFMEDRPHPPPFGGWHSGTQNIALFLALFFLSLMLRISDRWRKAEKEKTERELSYLKAQINPHFLFNTLNSIYSLAVNKSDETASAVVKLSGMMRYVLTDATHDFVPLQKEIDYIKDYIELQELRFGTAVPITFSVTGTAIGYKIAPLMLITFVENAFKYGLNAEDDSLIKISIDINDRILTVMVYNKKVRVQPDPLNRHGVGISNTKARLALLYPARYELTITNTDKDFTILLTLNI